MPALSPEKGATDKSKESEVTVGRSWKTILDMTDEQSRKFQAAMKARGDTVVPLRRELKVARNKLKVQLEARTDQNDVKTTRDLVVQLRDLIQDANDKLIRSLYDFLYSNQRDKILTGLPPHQGLKRLDMQGSGANDMHDAVSGQDGE